MTQLIHHIIHSNTHCNPHLHLSTQIDTERKHHPNTGRTTSYV